MKTLLLTLALPVMMLAQSEALTDAQSALEKGDYPGGMAVVNQVLAESDTTKEALLLGAKLAVKLDDLNLAKGFMESANKLDPKDEELLATWEDLKTLSMLMREGQKAFDSAFYDEAIQSYDSTLTKFPDFALASYMKGMVYFFQEEYDPAVYNFQNAVKLNPYEEKYKKAILNIASKFYNMGNDDSRRRDYKLAIVDYKKALEYNSEFPEAYFRLAYAHYKLKNYDNAIRNINTELGLSPSDAQAWKLKGDIYMRTKDYESAIECYGEAIKINSNYDKALFARAKVLHSLGQLDAALADLNNCLFVNPANTKAYELRGLVYFDRGTFDEAISDFKSVVENDPRDYVVWYRLASAYNAVHENERAREAAKTSLDIKNSYVAAYYELGIAEKCGGNKIAALDAFKKAIEEDRRRQWKDLCIFQIDNIDKPCDDS